MTPIRPTNPSKPRALTAGKPAVDWLSSDHQFSLLIQTQAKLASIQADLNQHLSLRGLQVASIESQTLTLITHIIPIKKLQVDVIIADGSAQKLMVITIHQYSFWVC